MHDLHVVFENHVGYMYNLLAHVANITTNETLKCRCMTVDYMEVIQLQVYWKCFWSRCHNSA